MSPSLSYICKHHMREPINKMQKSDKLQYFKRVKVPKMATNNPTAVQYLMKINKREANNTNNVQ